MMRGYDLLLWLYPASFRNEYGRELRSHFERRRAKTQGLRSMVALWMTAVVDILSNAAVVHWDLLLQDLRFTLRGLRRSPGFAVTVITVMALGIGANIAAFSVTDFVLVRPLPFADADRLVKLWETVPGYSQMEFSPANLTDFKKMSRSFESIASYHSVAMNMVGQGEPERLEGTAADAALFPMLGVSPLLGRTFTSAEDANGAAGTLVLSYSLWQGLFGGASDALGRRVILDDEPYVVIGVMPAGFNFPTRTSEFWIPSRYPSSVFEERDNTYLQVLAKLKPGVALEQAQSEMDVIARQLKDAYPKDNEKVGARLLRLRDELSGQSRMLLVSLCGAALCTLLIACSNVASLLTTRALARQRELAVRAALGAGRERLVRQMLTESSVLALFGGAVGIGVALLSVPLLTTLVPNTLPIAQKPSLDLRMLVVAASLTVATGIIFGVVPAYRASRKADFGGLREGVRSGGRKKDHVRAALVITEVAASMILLVASGLLIRALWKVQSTDPGFRTQNILTMRTALPLPKYEKTAAKVRFYDQVLSEVRQLPGVNSAAYISFLPMVMRGGIWSVVIPGKAEKGTAGNSASLRFVTPGFFSTLGIPLQAGRDVAESDAADHPPVAVVSESFARKYWPNENPIGQQFQFAFANRTVIGVVGNVSVRGLERASEPQVYLSYRQVEDGSVPFYAPKDLVISSSSDLQSLVPAVREIIHRVDPNQPISSVRTMAEIVEGETQSRRVQVRVLGAFATIAFVLAAVGIYGLLAFAVSQRANEIGVRIALGAQSRDIFNMVLQSSVQIGIAGLLPGVVLAYAGAKAMQALLAGIAPRDPITFFSAAAVCFLMTLLGGLPPALRAARLDPMKVIRTE